MGRSCPNKQFRVIQTQKQEILTVKSEVTAMGSKLKTLAVRATDKIRRFLANLSSFLSRARIIQVDCQQRIDLP